MKKKFDDEFLVFDDDREPRDFAPGDIVKHFKRETVDPESLEYLYTILFPVEHSETGEKMMVYSALYGDKKKYVRPMEMFMSEVDKEKYPEIRQQYRFERMQGALPYELTFAAFEEESNSKTVFTHRVDAALGGLIRSFRIMNGAYPTARCERDLGGHPNRRFPNVDDVELTSVDLSETVIEDIMGIIKNHESVFAIQELPRPTMLDGYRHTFRISDGERFLEIHPSNTQYYKKHPEKANAEVKELLSLYHEICDCLKKAGVDPSFLELA